MSSLVIHMWMLKMIDFDELKLFRNIDELREKRIENKKKGRRLSDNDIDMIVIHTKYHKMGIRQIAKKLGCHKTTVMYWRKKLNLPARVDKEE